MCWHQHGAPLQQSSAGHHQHFWAEKDWQEPVPCSSTTRTGSEAGRPQLTPREKKGRAAGSCEQQHSRCPPLAQAVPHPASAEASTVPGPLGHFRTAPAPHTSETTSRDTAEVPPSSDMLSALQTPHGWLSTSHPRWAGTKSPTSPLGTVQQHPARLSSERGRDASLSPWRGLGGQEQGTHLLWSCMVMMVGKGRAQGPALIPALAARALLSHQHVLGDAGDEIHVEPHCTRSVSRNKTTKCRTVGCAARDLQPHWPEPSMVFDPTVPPSSHYNPKRSGIHHFFKERLL